MANISAYMGTFIVWGIIAVFALFSIMIIGLIVFFVIRWLRYKVNVTIFEKVGFDSWLGRRIRAREVNNGMNDGKRKSYIQLISAFKGKSKLLMPNSEDFVVFGRIKEINLAYINGFFFPMKPVEHSPPVMEYNLADVQRAMESWDADYIENVETHRGQSSFMDKYGTLLGIGMILITQFLFLIIIITVVNGHNPGTAAASAVQQVIK